jgi:hypothetical protein
MNPEQGGSYVRNKDGSLTRAGTQSEKPVKPTKTETPDDGTAAKKEK